MILALVVDTDGRPICTEMLPGNTADVTVLVPVVDRLRPRFSGDVSPDDIAQLLDKHRVVRML